MSLSTEDERNKIRVGDRPAACLAEIRQWLRDRNAGKFTAAEQYGALVRLSEWGSANLLCALIAVLENE